MGLQENYLAMLNFHYGDGNGPDYTAHRVDHYDAQHATDSIRAIGRAVRSSEVKALIIKLRRLVDSAIGIGGNGLEHARLRSDINAVLPKNFRIRQGDILPVRRTHSRSNKRTRVGNPWR